MIKCPPHYFCQFTPQKPYVIHQVVHIGPWYYGAWGVITAILAVSALAAVLIILVSAWNERKNKQLDAKERQLVRQHEAFLAEQRTLQLDTAHGNADLVKSMEALDHGR